MIVVYGFASGSKFFQYLSHGIDGAQHWLERCRLPTLSDGHPGSFPSISFRMVDDAGPVKKLVRFECTYLPIIWVGVFLGLLLRRRARMAEDHFESADDRCKGVSLVAQTIHSPETAKTKSHANGRYVTVGAHLSWH